MPDQSFIIQSRKQWSSEPAFIASMAAAAVGLGNLWRFPYIVGENGGGVFVIAYLLALFIVVLPIMMLEVAAGRLTHGNTVATFRQVNRLGSYYGWLVVTITIAITSYYLVITGWTLGYAIDASRGELRVFDQFTEGYNSFWYFLVIIGLASIVLINGLKSIERLSKLLMPLLLTVMIFLVVMASKTSGWEQTINFFFKFDWSKMTSGELWVFAFGQAFYTLAIGQGYLITYGSYIPRKTNLPRACIIVAVFQTSIALLAAWMIFPFVFSQGLSPEEGTQLAFATMPKVFTEMSAGWFIGIVFFVLFFAAAFTSTLAGLKVVVSAFAEEFGITNFKAVMLVALVMLIFGSASALSFTPMNLQIAGEPVLDMVDRIAGGNIIILSGIIGAALFCWFIPPAKIHSVLGTYSHWWEWRIYLVGRFLPIFMLITILMKYFS
ncbi:sodium-dependent transporter [Methylophaga sp.]|jgi:NSS family neurotransmitter:Na+ symporter|uniref:sodium-dependent transporter n=1 Tax=Methylophaga sp. TaxID=2024840 RepID=UPI0025FE9959|nr:sodium-dependent transporter [Methylophaga sp.]|tara:strand:- start:3910 stop:5220 length:1311 start_codon:yes stop_codon:yes gene_type:complete